MAISVPATGDGTSASTLSVEISSRASSFSILSPTDLSHLETVPSVIDSPIWGITTSAACSLFVGGCSLVGTAGGAAATTDSSTITSATGSGATATSTGVGVSTTG